MWQVQWIQELEREYSVVLNWKWNFKCQLSKLHKQLHSLYIYLYVYFCISSYHFFYQITTKPYLKIYTPIFLILKKHPMKDGWIDAKDTNQHTLINPELRNKVNWIHILKRQRVVEVSDVYNITFFMNSLPVMMSKWNAIKGSAVVTCMLIHRCFLPLFNKINFKLLNRERSSWQVEIGMYMRNSKGYRWTN